MRTGSGPRGSANTAISRAIVKSAISPKVIRRISNLLESDMNFPELPEGYMWDVRPIDPDRYDGGYGIEIVISDIIRGATPHRTVVRYTKDMDEVWQAAKWVYDEFIAHQELRSWAKDIQGALRTGAVEGWGPNDGN
ncbi:hypothetical protein [Mycolicibacterium septicum]|uniref:hypothetical protein n=1 Tax=Mycolicibacterium septicum TaxID=98668 RepID=UPI001AF09B52|nr:hypothetical protein [Mycolicibacterium septicum]QRY51782.1 hypothetical protein JVX95_31150 [Mycolicibacterium septicum]